MERCTRPWGWYETLTEGEGYLVKRLWLDPGQRLSLQRHQHRPQPGAEGRELGGR